jgi:hypothetical protein
MLLGIVAGCADSHPQATEPATPAAAATQACPSANRGLCEVASTIDGLLRRGEISSLLSNVSFDPTECVSAGPGPISAAEQTMIAACTAAAPGFPEGSCRYDEQGHLPEGCVIQTTSVHMCSCGATQGNLRRLTPEQYSGYIVPHASVYAIIDPFAFGGTLRGLGSEHGPFILVRADSLSMPGEGGWPNVPTTWALEVDTTSSRVIMTWAFREPLDYFDGITPIPWP